MSSIKFTMLIFFGLFTVLATVLASKTMDSQGISPMFGVQLFSALMGVGMSIFTIINF